MERMYDLVTGNESWLAERVRAFVRRNGGGTSPGAMEDSWRASISDLCAALTYFSKDRVSSPGTVGLEESPSDPASAFGVSEARRHRGFDVDLRFSLSLLKFYRRLCFDLARGSGFSREDQAVHHRYIERFFDRAEEAFLVERERASAGERDRYAAVFENLPGPAFLLDANGCVENLSRSAAALLGEDTAFGGAGHAAKWKGKRLPVLVNELVRFQAADIASRSFYQVLDTSIGRRVYRGEMRRILDGSGKVAGTSILLADQTRRIEAEEKLQVVLEEIDARVAERSIRSGMPPGKPNSPKNGELSIPVKPPASTQ